MSTGLSTVAAHYADAIMQLASDSGVDKTVLEDLKSVKQVVSQTHDFQVVLRHPGVPPQEKKQLIKFVFGGKVHELTLRLLELLADKRRLELIPHIESSYQDLWRKKQNIVAGTLLYAERPENKILDEIKAKLEKKLGKTLELDEKEDKTLIGGYVLRLGDQLIDGSLKGRLQAIEKALLSV
jgi:F-type H+-transporting ATPase subunit delta